MSSGNDFRVRSASFKLDTVASQSPKRCLTNSFITDRTPSVLNPGAGRSSVVVPLTDATGTTVKWG